MYILTCSCVELNSHSQLQHLLFVKAIVMKLSICLSFKAEDPCGGMQIIVGRGKGRISKQGKTMLQALSCHPVKICYATRIFRCV